MAKITFVQTELRDRYGTLSLYSYLKKYGHESEVFCKSAEPDIVNSVLETDPDIIGFSTMTTEYKSHLSIANEIKRKKKDIPVIFGGPHPTFYPEIINERSIDVVCINEGEDPLLDLMNVLDKCGNLEPAANIKNLCVKVNDNVTRNVIRNMIEDLDILSPRDRDIYYDRYEVLRSNSTKTIYVGRGCPFSCTYCFNHSLIKMVKGKGKYIRLRSIDNVFDEIRFLNENYGLKWVQFNDDTFNFSREWLNEFLDRYPDEIGIPFICNVRADYLDENIVKKLKKAGCDRVNFGVEHGSFKIRKNLLKRNITDEQLVNAGKYFRENKIRVYTSNIIGLPGETIDNAMETIEINRKIKPEFSAFNMLQPFPKTEIFDYAKEHGFISDAFSFGELSCFTTEFKSDVSSTQIQQKNIKELINIQNLSYFLIHFPFLTPLIKGILIKLPFTGIYQKLYLMVYYTRRIKFESSIKKKLSIIKSIFK